MSDRIVLIENTINNKSFAMVQFDGPLHGGLKDFISEGDIFLMFFTIDDEMRSLYQHLS